MNIRSLCPLLPLLRGTCLAVALITGPCLHAAEVPGFDRAVAINAREQPVDQFLSELYGQLRVPVRIADGVTGSVNGDFRKSAREVFHDIASSFQLSVYYDGAVAYIYPSNDIVHNVLYMPRSTASNIDRVARKMGLPDAHNNISVADVGLVVTGAPQFVEQVEKMSVALRKNEPAPQVSNHDTYRTFQLRYAWADDVSLEIGGETLVVPGVASLIRSLIEPGALQGSALGSYRIPDSATLDGLRGQGLKSVDNESLRQLGSATQSVPDTFSNADDGSTANTRIVADALSNSVIIRDKADRMRAYEELIRSLDKEPQMIEIEATIIDLDTNKLRELGVNWRLQRDNSEALLGQGTSADNNLRPNSDVTPSGEGGFISLVLGSQQQFIARIKALETQGAARIVSKPHVMTLSNVEALLDTTSTFFVRVEGQEEVDLFDVSVGTTLRVTPHVYERGGRSQIKLRVNIEDGTTSDRLVDQIPVVENSTIATQAIIDVGQSLLIGGLVRETRANGTTRVPFLGSIPVLGGLFRTQSKTSTRTERMFLITPRVTNPKLAGKRFSAPILSGEEADIIQSAPARMETTRQSLTMLDEVYPVEQSLPKGDTLRTEHSRLVEPFVPIQSSIDTRMAQNPAALYRQPQSLRERLPSDPVSPATPRTQEQTASVSRQTVPVSSASAADERATDASDGWQEIPVAPAVAMNRVEPEAADRRIITDTQASAVDVSASADENNQPRPVRAVDENGWQVIY